MTCVSESPVYRSSYSSKRTRQRNCAKHFATSAKRRHVSKKRQPNCGSARGSSQHVNERLVARRKN